jgi:hypothetical protein
MSKIKPVFFIIFFSFIIIGNVFAEIKVEPLKIINQFPTYDQMVKGNFSIYGGRDFDIHKEYIYMSDHFGHTIFKFDLDGNYIKQFGQEGQGPGDLQYPHRIQVYHEKLYVTDNMNSRIQIFNLDGQPVKQIKLLTAFSGMKLINDKLIIHNNADYAKTKKIFEIYNLKGDLLFIKKNKTLQSRYKDAILDSLLHLQISDGLLHGLQIYGTKYLVYDPNGRLVKEFELKSNPLEEKEYKKIKYLYTYPCFCVYGEKIYAGVCWRGKLVIKVFNMEGEFLHQLEGEMKEQKDIYYPNKVKIIHRHGKEYLYILFTSPDSFFIVAELNL